MVSFLLFQPQIRQMIANAIACSSQLVLQHFIENGGFIVFKDWLKEASKAAGTSSLRVALLKVGLLCLLAAAHGRGINDSSLFP